MTAWLLAGALQVKRPCLGCRVHCSQQLQAQDARWQRTSSHSPHVDHAVPFTTPLQAKKNAIFRDAVRGRPNKRKGLVRARPHTPGHAPATASSPCQ